jgi:hypothetical protein
MAGSNARHAPSFDQRTMTSMMAADAGLAKGGVVVRSGLAPRGENRARSLRLSDRPIIGRVGFARGSAWRPKQP